MLVGGVVAADYRNAHRTESSDPLVTALDYVPGEGEDTDPRREEAKQNIYSAYLLMGNMTAEQTARQRARIIASLRDQGFDDAEEMFNEVFPED